METFDNVLAEEHLKSLISALLTVLHLFFFFPSGSEKCAEMLKEKRRRMMYFLIYLVYN